MLVLLLLLLLLLLPLLLGEGMRKEEGDTSGNGETMG
jgi:hypothetical protein